MMIRNLSLASRAALGVANKRLLLRDYIQQALYDPTHGYFSNITPPLLHRHQPIDFPSLPTRQAYQRTVAKTYAKTPHGWMTPVEIFSPHFSHAVANRIRSASPSHTPIHVIELGAGRATLAKDILAFLERYDPLLLQRLSYTLVDVSPTLSNLQRVTLARWIDSGVVNVVCADARHWFADYSTAGAAQRAHVHVIATELLDNLPHDLIRITSANDIQQAYLTGYTPNMASEPERQSRMMEWDSEIDVDTAAAMRAFNFNSDPSFPDVTPSFTDSLRSTFDTLMNRSGAEEIWVPTACYTLLRAIVSATPDASLTFADFTSFPGALPGMLAPVVQRVQRGTAVVYDRVEDAPFGKVDIMFPTDFHRLGHAYRTLLCDRACDSPNGEHVQQQVVSQAEFFQHFATDDATLRTSCADGYNPLLQDFENAALLLTDHGTD